MNTKKTDYHLIIYKTARWFKTVYKFMQINILQPLFSNG